MTPKDSVHPVLKLKQIMTIPENYQRMIIPESYQLIEKKAKDQSLKNGQWRSRKVEKALKAPKEIKVWTQVILLETLKNHS